MPRSEASSGYAGDVSVGSEDSSSEDSGDGIKPGFTISVTEQRTRSLHSTRRRKRSTTQSKGIAPSPIHPDIDISLTHHMTYSDLMGLRPPLNNAAASSSIQPTEALSRLLFGYFALIRTHAANSEVKNKGATMEGKSLDTASMQSDAKQAPKRSARCSATKEDKKLPSKRNPSKTLQTENEHEIQGSAKPQIIAANPTLVRDAPTTFSSEHLFLEDALALTKTPRYAEECPVVCIFQLTASLTCVLIY